MKSHEFILPFAAAAGLFYGAAVWPELASSEMLRSAAGLFALAWAGLALALPKLTELLNLEGLTTAQREVLSENILRARAKIWRIGGLSLFCVICLFVVPAIAQPEQSQLVAGFLGLVVGFVVELMFAYRKWNDEVHEFSSAVRKKHLEAKARESTLGRLSKSS